MSDAPKPNSGSLDDQRVKVLSPDALEAMPDGRNGPAIDDLGPGEVEVAPGDDLQPLEFFWADGPRSDAPSLDELVEDFITMAGTSVLYGDSNTGKTFLAVDLAIAVAQAQDDHARTWFGKRIDGGLVVYLATESPASIELRLAAYRKATKKETPNIVVVKTPIDLFGNIDCLRVIRLIAEIEKATGRKCRLIIGDTLARMSAGANENSGQDMALVFKHLDIIRAATGAHVLMIHHCGKDEARGMRGWSGMRAHIDTEVNLKANDKEVTFEVTKQRDLNGKGWTKTFALVPVELGIGKWGKPTTSCFVQPLDGGAVSGKAKATTRKLSDEAAILLDVLKDVIHDHGTQSAGTSVIPAGKRTVTNGQLQSRYFTRNPLGPDADLKKADARRKKYERARERLQAEKIIGVHEELVWKW